MQTRREFLKKSAALLGSAAVVGSVPGLLKAQAEDGQEVPAYPYPYVELDPAYVEKLAYEGYFENGCCFGVAKAILVALREKVGYPYTVIPEEMFANGKEGYTCGTLCGAPKARPIIATTAQTSTTIQFVPRCKYFAERFGPFSCTRGARFP